MQRHSDALAPGTRLEEFEIEHPLGHGKFRRHLSRARPSA